MVFRSIFLFMLIYTFIRNTSLDKDRKVRIAGIIFMAGGFLFGEVILFYGMNQWYHLLGIALYEVLLITAYLVFYNNDVFIEQIKWFIPITVGYIFFLLFKGDGQGLVIYSLGCLWCILIAHEHINRRIIFIIGLVSIGCTMLIGETKSVFFLVIIIISIDQLMRSTYSENSKNMELMQRKFLAHQYEEIKSVYLNMRGWRHDYHNHIQTMKAYLAMNQIEELDRYLFQLQNDLDKVDNLVNSGNIMMDAILNSKISIMFNRNIQVDFKAELPENLKINDVDLCVMVSNLLENAIEACGKISEEKRFIRIFSEVHGSQFYLSIQNSAQENPDFNAKNYITSKRGEHGLGMKRVQFLVEKYKGFLNLQNEPGIFASEITIPL